jgi:prephenate dehydratase
MFNMPGILYFSSFEGVFQAVEKGMCRYGVLPLENSLAGSVTDVYDLMKAHKFFIARSVKLRIEHRLLTVPGVALTEIREIVAHEQALRQCAPFLSGLKDVKLTPFANNATAARYVADSGRRDIAAIASARNASLYGLEPLEARIMDDGSNYTRFICISRDMEIYPGANRISLMASLPHTPGSLYRAVARFAVEGLNLLKLESRPVPGRDFEFMFYFDFEGSVVDQDVKTLLSELSSRFWATTARCDMADFYGLLGGRLGHSYSKLIHERMYGCEYRLIELPPEELEGFLRGRGFLGLNVTIPFKQAVIPFCDRLTDEAARIGAVNTLYFDADGALTGDNTDIYGA